MELYKLHQKSRSNRKYSSAELNQAFNDFLNIRALDKKILNLYQNALLKGSEQFAHIFYKYLLASPATAKVLNTYQATGGKIEDLTKTQLGHLKDLLSGDTSAESATRLEYIGEVHYRYSIEPVWIMGAYLLYLDHLQTVIRTNSQIDSAHRNALEDSVTKLLFRDMGMLLEGYWDTSLQTLQQEQAKVVRLQDQINSLLSNIPQLLWSVDVTTNEPIYTSPNIHKVCGRDISMPIPCMEWTVPQDHEKVKLAWDQAIAGNSVEIESRVIDPKGEIRWFRRVFRPYKNERGEVVRIDGLMEDATETKNTIERLHTLATTDSLTGLLNRALLRDRLKLAIALARREDKNQVILIFMDLDRFKEINDTLGHPAGDEVLVMAAQRLKNALRESDTLARLGGDEFAILASGKDGKRLAENIADKVLACLNSPFHYLNNELFLGASMGIAVYPDHGDDVDTLMSRADVAMYTAKRRGTGYLFYEAASDPNTQERLKLANELRRALENDQLQIYYQPKISLDTGQVDSIEALLRWHHPERGLIFPDEFIPMAEHSGLMQPITDWVLRTAGTQCKKWNDQGHPLRLAVNISGRVFQNVKLIDHIKRTLIEMSIPANYLELEITENELMSDVSHVSSMLHKLCSLGVTIAIDDFGTGYSSLAYLKELPLHTLKIDKSFVLHITENENDAVIVRSMIDLAHNLGRKTVAEGIEDQDTWDILTILGCDYGQGHFISQPLAAMEFDHWLRHSPPLITK